MNKATKIRTYLRKHPDASPIFVSKKLGVSYGYAYKIVREERGKRETVTEKAPNTPSEVKSWWRTFTRTIRVNIRLAIRKVRSWIS